MSDLLSGLPHHALATGHMVGIAGPAGYVLASDVAKALRSDEAVMVGARALARRKYDMDYSELSPSRQVECRVEARAVLTAAAGGDDE